MSRAFSLAVQSDYDWWVDKRRELQGAIAELTAYERAQLLLYLLEDDFRALEIVDGRKWRFYEVAAPLSERLDTALWEATRPDPGASLGEEV